MIRIRPGRSWRHNPSYLRELREGKSGADILDVLGVEVDGVDIAAGVGEAQVLLAVAELAAALQHIAEGTAAAQATIGPGLRVSHAPKSRARSSRAGEISSAMTRAPSAAASWVAASPTGPCPKTAMVSSP